MKSVLEKTNNVMRFIFLFGLIYLVNDAQCAGKCYCGFGGPCRFNRDTHEVVKTDCSKCGMASKGLYRNCHQLLNHCDSKPCENGGKCVMTFGGFFCRCPPEFYGHTCENTRKKYETFEQVSGPRVWYQVNRIWGGLSRQNQIIHFAVETPGDGMVVHVNFDDGRSITILDTDLRMNNERKTCLEESRKWSLSNDPNICETLPDEVLFSKEIHVGYFDDKFNPKPDYDVMTAEVRGKNVSEGRLDDVQITILNWRRITYTQKYRIHTVYDIWPKCLYKINFFGCSLDKETPVLHEGGSSVYLKAIRIPITDCGGAGRVRQMKWYMEGAGGNPFLSHRNKEEVHLDGTELSPGRHFVDFLMTVEGRPNFHGHPDLSYNYGRCWIKIVLGQFRVGIEGGNSVTAPCVKPLTLRIFSYNKNYKELNFASIWRCNMKYLEVCKRQRFLGSKIFFRTLPCGIIVQFKAMIVDVPTGSKNILTASVKTSIHIDTMHCSCTYNCYPTINPLSPVKMRVEMIRYSTSKLPAQEDIKWRAVFADEPWGIEQFILPETLGTGIEIPPNTFSNLSSNEIAFPVLQVTAFKLDIYCTVEMSVSTPISTPIVGVSMAPHYVEDIQDSRYRVFILKHAMANSDTPFSYVLSEAVTPNSSVREVVGFILGDIQQFEIAKMQYQSYVTCRDHDGLESRPKFLDVHSVQDRTKNISIKNKVAVIRNLALTGNDDAALTELLYVSRIIALSKRQMHSHKMQLMEIMNDITAVMDRSANGLIVSARMNKVLNTINRLMLISNLTDPPFNVSIDPWKLPFLPARRGSASNWINMYVAASQTLHSVTTYYYYHLVQRVTIPIDRSVLELMFNALLKVQLSKRWQEFMFRILGMYPVQEFQKRTQAVFITEFMQKAIVLLMKSIDFHIVGHEGSLNFSRGTTTASGSVLPAYSAMKWSGETFNDYQDVRISVNVNDETVGESDPLYLGVFVEIPVLGEITPLVHVFLWTHLTQRNVKGTIDIHMHTNHTRKKCVAHCTTTDVARSSETGSVAIFKLEMNEPDFAVNRRLVRQLRIHMTSLDGVRAVIRARVPRHSEVARAPSKRDMDLINIVDYRDVFMGVLPGNGIHPGVPIPWAIDTAQFMCIQKSYGDPTSADNLASKSICQMLPSAREDSNTTTCRCSGSGVVYTYELEMRVKKILVGNENGTVQRASPPEYKIFNFVMLLFPALFLLVVVFAVWRDKVTWKREFIQELADTFPDDGFAYIVGVLTGKRLLAGTRAHVAIQISGMSASSRVHILSSKSYKVLGWGQDDWFSVFTPEHLGKLSHVSLWQDYSALCSSWYCSKVVVYDVKHQTWYEFNVEKWSTISADSDESRIMVASGRKYLPEKLMTERFKFKQHYWREIKNTHSLMSPLLKQRRFLHSYCMRACLTLTFVLTLVSLVIIMDHCVGLMGVPLYYDNIIAIAVFATIIASIPYTIASFFFTRSLVKMKKTKTLDLGLADQMRNRWLDESDPSERELPAYSIHDFHRISAFDLANKHERETTREKSVSRKSVRSKKGRSFPNPIFAIQVHKWMASSIYRPIRIEDYGLRRLVVGFHVCGWVLVSFTILGNIIFLIYWLARLGWLEGRNGILIVSVAIAFELVRSSLIVLLLSCYTVYHQKRCNFEINCLDLSGLRNNARIVDHREFIIAATKSYYHPLKTDEVQAMYQKKVKKMSYVKMFGFLLLFLGMVLPTLIIAWKKDTKNIFRVKRTTTDVYREPVWNNYTLEKKRLRNIHSMDDLSDYLLGTLMPATMVHKWYNNKMMRPADLYLEENNKKKYWFVDRSSRLQGASTARFLYATNASKLYIARPFRVLDLPIFSEAYGQYDAYDEYNTSYNRRRAMMKQKKSEPFLDNILSRGVTGVTGIFYPASVGEKIVLRRDVEEIEEGVRLAMKRVVKKYTRAIIVEISIIHPLFSQEAFNPMFGVTILEIILENCASGPYTGSIKSSFFFAKTSINYLRFGIIYSLLMTACIIAIGINLADHGFRACTKSLLVWTLFFGSISCFVATLTNLAIHNYVDFQEMAPKSDGDAHVDYHNIVWLKELTYSSSGFFCMLGAMAWAMWSAELTGMSKARFEDNFARLLSSYSIFLFFKYCIGTLLSWGTHERAVKFERISKTPHCTIFSEPSCALFIAVSNFFLWTLQIGVTIGIIESFLSRNTGGLSNALAYPKRFYKLQKKILFRESSEYERSRNQILAVQTPSQEVDTTKSNDRLKIKFSFLK